MLKPLIVPIFRHMQRIASFIASIILLCFVSAQSFCQQTVQSTAKPEILSKAEIGKIFTDDVKKELTIDLPIRRVYKYSDKAGINYIVLMEQYNGKDENKDTICHQIKAICLLSDGAKFTKQWALNDFIIKQVNGNGTESSISFWTKYFELKDSDNDGIIDPVITYGSFGTNGVDDGRIKILIYYKGQKIAIRHQNGVLDEERNTTVDQSFYSLPTTLQNSVMNIMKRIMADKNGIFPADWDKGMKAHKLKLLDQPWKH